MTDLDYIHHAMQLALKAKGNTSPNPLVGAVIVKGNRMIAQGWHHRCGSDHAEIIALKKAGTKAQGAKLYVTLEPCFHYGRTPPCVDKIIQSGIKEVIVGMKDPNPLTNGKSIQKLKLSGIKTKVGFLQNELSQMNEAFVKYQKTRMPFVVAKCAQTLDGKIATATGQSQWITSVKTRAFARGLRNDFDAILVGINTVLKDNPGLNAERQIKPIRKIILDSSLQISISAKLFSDTQPSQCIVATTAQASAKKIKFFQNKGVHVIICPEKDARIDLKWLFKELAKLEIISILIEGGATVIGSALKENLVDKMHFYLAPKIIGDQTALNSVVGFKINNVNQAVSLENLTLKKIDKDIFITAYVHRHH